MRFPVVSVVVALTLGLFAAPLGAEAQPARKTSARVGFLGYASPTTQSRSLDAFRQGLRDVGWVEGASSTAGQKATSTAFPCLPPSWSD